MDPLLEYRAKLIARAESLVADCADAVADIPEERWHQPAAPGLPSPHEITARLRDFEAFFLSDRLEPLVHGDDSDLGPRWQNNHDNPDEPLEDILKDFARLRENLLAQLREFTPADWSRAGRHQWHGLRTVQWWVERLVALNEERLRELRRKAEARR